MDTNLLGPLPVCQQVLLSREYPLPSMLPLHVPHEVQASRPQIRPQGFKLGLNMSLLGGGTVPRKVVQQESTPGLGECRPVLHKVIAAMPAHGGCTTRVPDGGIRRVLA